MPDYGPSGDRKDFKYIGGNTIGALSLSIAKGYPKFPQDIVVPNMLHGKFLRSPYAHARIKSIDITKAKALPGVVAVLKWDDPALKPFQGTTNSVLDDEADKWDQEVGAVVVAETEELCDQALALIQVEWDVLPFYLDPLDSMKSGAAILQPKRDPKSNTTFINWTQGDIEAGFKEADQILEFDFNESMTTAFHPNPAVGVAWIEGDEYGPGGQTMIMHGGATNGANPMASNQYTRAWGWTGDQFRYPNMWQGGRYCDFGTRRSTTIAPILAKLTGRPVRLIQSRQNQFDCTNVPIRHLHFKIGLKNDGRITAVYDTMIGEAGTRGSAALGQNGDLKYNPFYTTLCKNLKTDGTISATNTSTVQFGQPHPFVWHNMTLALHKIAEKLGMDPIDVALKNIHGNANSSGPLGPDKVILANMTGQDDAAPQPSLVAAIQAAKKLYDWQWPKPNTKKLADGRMHGISFHFGMCPRHGETYYSMFAYINQDGRVIMPLRGPWRGIYTEDICRMAVAEEVGIDPKDVVLKYDTNAFTHMIGGGSDAGTGSTYWARECGVKLKAAILERAAPMLQNNLNNPPAGTTPPATPYKLTPADLDTKDGTVFLKADPTKTIAFSALLSQGVLAAVAAGKPPPSAWMTTQGRVTDLMDAIFCEVAVDTETGAVEISKWVLAADVGKVMRLRSLEGQVEQSMIINTGYGLGEEWVFDKATGVLLNPNLIDYKKPTMLDRTPVDMTFLESRAGNGAYGGGGISHNIASTTLVTCAVWNAIGVWIDPPITPDKVLKALGKA